MIITIEEAKKIIIEKVEKLTEDDIETGEDGSLLMHINLYWWASDKKIHDEYEPREIFNAWLNDASKD